MMMNFFSGDKNSDENVNILVIPDMCTSVVESSNVNGTFSECTTSVDMEKMPSEKCIKLYSIPNCNPYLSSAWLFKEHELIVLHSYLSSGKSISTCSLIT